MLASSRVSHATASNNYNKTEGIESAYNSCKFLGVQEDSRDTCEKRNQYDCHPIKARNSTSSPCEDKPINEEQQHQCSPNKYDRKPPLTTHNSLLHNREGPVNKSMCINYTQEVHAIAQEDNNHYTNKFEQRNNENRPQDTYFENKNEHEIKKKMDDSIPESAPVPTALKELDLSFIKNKHLFDRRQEIKSLQESFRRSLSPYSRPEFILISGESGTGKTVLADKLQDLVSSQNGFYIRGKFDQLQKPQPYSAFVSAFTEFVRMVLEKRPEIIKNLKQSIRNGVKLDKQLLVEIFPALEHIAELTQSEDNDRNILGAEVRSRLETVVYKFITSISSLDAPLVLVMDDLQWADSGSLDLLEFLLSYRKINGLVFVGICRSNEVSINHDFAGMLRRIEDTQNIMLTHILVKSLSWKAANEMASWALRLPTELCKPVTEVLFEKTEGNVLFFMELLQRSYNDGLFLYDDKHGAWIWDEKKLLSESHQYNVSDLFLRRVAELPDETKTALMSAACLGAECDAALLSIILKDINIHNALQIPIDKGIVKYDKQLQRYYFCHDQIQQAAYALISDNEKPFVHITIGRLLWKSLSQQQLNKHIFLVVDQMVRGRNLNHLVRGVSHLEDQVEKNKIASLCFTAGRKAVKSSSFGTASIYFWHGIELLANGHWVEDYDLSLALYSAVVETEYCNAKFEKMDNAIEEVLTNARSPLDKIRVYTAKVYSLWPRGRQQEAINVGVDALELFGVTFPKKIKKIYTLKEILKTKYLLLGKGIPTLLSGPDMTDPNIIAAMGLLNHLIRYTLVVRPNMFPLIATQLVQLSLKHGLCAISAYGYCAYAGILIHLQDFDSSLKYSRLSLGILNRFEETKEVWRARVHMCVYGSCDPWHLSARLSLNPLLSAHKAGMEAGDIEFAIQCSWMHNMLAFVSGMRLPYVIQKFKDHLEITEKLKHFQPAQSTKLGITAVNTLMQSNGNNPLDMARTEMYNIEIDNRLDTMFIVQRSFWCLILAYYFGNTDVAMEVSESPHYETGVFKLTILIISKYFYAGLASLDALRTCRKKERKKLMGQAKKAIKQLKKYSNVSAHNCMNKILLLEAEFGDIKGGEKIDDILQLCDRSIDYASAEGFLHEQALANERASLFLQRQQLERVQDYQMSGVDDTNTKKPNNDIAYKEKKYLDNAMALYKQWGAHGKIASMRKDR